MLKPKNYILFNTILFTIVLLFSSILPGFGSDQKKAASLLNEGNYTEALPLYNELNLLYPNDPLFQYGYGVCLTATGNIGQKAKKLLLQAAQSDVPLDVYYYIGKNYHGQQNFETAISYYQRFEETASRKVKKRFDAEEMIRACQEKQVPFDVSPEPSLSRPINALTDNSFDTDSITDTTAQGVLNRTSGSEKQIEEKVQLNSSDDGTLVPKDSTQQGKQEAIQAQQKILQVSFPDTSFNFTINPEVHYLKIEQFRTTEGKNRFIEAWNQNQKLNNILDTIKTLREDYEQLDNEQIKASIAEQVVKLEQEAIRLKNEIDNSYLQSNEAEMAYWNSASNNEIQKLQQQNDSIESELKALINNEAPLEQNKNSYPLDSLEMMPDSLPAIDSVKTVQEEPEVNKIVYRIQIGSFSKGLPEYIDRLYKKLAVLRRIDHYTDEKGITVYTIGEVSNLDDALKLQAQIRQEGVKDAFVVAYNNGKRITLKEAKELTKND